MKVSSAMFNGALPSLLLLITPWVLMSGNGASLYLSTPAALASEQLCHSVKCLWNNWTMYTVNPIIFGPLKLAIFDLIAFSHPLKLANGFNTLKVFLLSLTLRTAPAVRASSSQSRTSFQLTSNYKWHLCGPGLLHSYTTAAITTTFYL